MPNLLNKYGLRKSSIYFSIVSTIALLLLAFSKNNTLVIFAFIIYNLTNYFIVACLDIFIEDFSKIKKLVLFRGLYLSIINSSWVIAQLISGSIIAKTLS